MSQIKRKPYPRKHDPNLRPDPVIEQAIKKRGAGRELPCAIAFEIAAGLGVDPEEVGRTADLLDIPLAKCQLGLFGYQPENKIIREQDTANQDLKNALMGSSDNNRLSCKKAWQLAHRFNISKLALGNLCQANRIKIKACRLGAF